MSIVRRVFRDRNQTSKEVDFYRKSCHDTETIVRIVSCSDIVVLAARDAVFLAQGPKFQVLTGRRDGLVSRAVDAAELPDPQESIEILREKFRGQGLNDEGPVLLSAGAHTIGLTACLFVAPRLDARDPSVTPRFFPVLRSRCPEGGDVAVKIPLD